VSCEFCGYQECECNEIAEEHAKHEANKKNEIIRLTAQLKIATDALKYSESYLSENKRNLIGSGSKAHMEMQHALKQIKEVDHVPD